MSLQKLVISKSEKVDGRPMTDEGESSGSESLPPRLKIKVLKVKLSTTTLPGNLSFSWHVLSDHVSPVQLVGGRLGCSHVLLVDGQVVLHLVGESPTTGTVGSRGGRGGPELSSASSSHPKQPPSQLSLFLFNLSSSNPKTDLSEEKVQIFNIGQAAGRPSSISRDDISFAALLPSAVIHSVAHHKQTEVVLSDAIVQDQFCLRISLFPSVASATDWVTNSTIRTKKIVSHYLNSHNKETRPF